VLQQPEVLVKAGVIARPRCERIKGGVEEEGELEEGCGGRCGGDGGTWLRSAGRRLGRRDGNVGWEDGDVEGVILEKE
jgi:hypothetical protein